MDRAELAVEYKHNGNNCCQAVLLAFAEELNLPMEALGGLGSALGTGMGCLQANCGALCGAQMVVGYKKFEGHPLGAQAKEVHEKFRELCGATICKDIKGLETGKMLCSCDDCIRNAVKIVEEI